MNLQSNQPEAWMMAISCLILLAGCSGPSLHQPVISSTCEGIVSAGCEVVDGTLVVRGISISGQATGIHIHPMTDVRIENASVRDADDAISIDFSSCPDCEVSIVDSHLSASQSAIRLVGREGHVNVDSTVIHTEGGGTYRYETGRDGATTWNITMVQGGSSALTLPYESAMDVFLANVSIDANRLSAREAIGPVGSQVGSIHLVDVTISNYRAGMSYNADETYIDGLEIGCHETGIEVGHIHTGRLLSGRNLTITGCSEHNLWLGVQAAQLDSVRLTGGRVGIQGASTLNMANFIIENMDYGMKMKSDSPGPMSASISRGIVANNTFVGLETKYPLLDVRGVTFSNNGHGWPDPAIEEPLVRDDERKYGGLTWTSPESRTESRLDVQDCSFASNYPYGLATLSEPSIAVSNWWGSPDGPQVYIPAGVFAGASPPVQGGGHGDNSTWNVAFAPWLTSPP